jgi:uncharacterized protein YdaU (DUF1376 family)
VNYYQHHIGDFMRDTAYLSAVEEGIYRRAIDWYYANEKPLPSDIKLVCRYLRARDKAEIAAVNAVLSEFFVLTEDGYTQSRCDKEIEAYNGKAETNRVNGAKGGRPKSKPKTNPEETQSVNSWINSGTQIKGNQEPRTINQEPIKINNKNDQEQIQSVAAFAGLDLQVFKKIQALCPELTEQNVIDFAVFNGIDPLTEMNNRLKAYQQSQLEHIA